jgi:hypothetical protein
VIETGRFTTNANQAFVIDGELGDRTIELAASLARDLLAGGEEAALHAIADELGGPPPERALVGFFMCDRGKSEALLEASVPSAALGPYFTASEEQERSLVSARREVLEAETLRIERSGSAEAAEEALASCVAVIQDVRGSNPAHQDLTTKRNSSIWPEMSSLSGEPSSI